MAKVKVTKEEADRLMKIPGNTRGAVLHGHFDYIRNSKGEKGLKAVEQRLEELGYPIKAKEIVNLKWYSEALSNLIVLVYADIFQLEEKDIFEMAYQAPSYSLVVKLLMRHLIGLEKVFKEIPRYWRENFDFSKLETTEFNLKEKWAVLRLKGYHKYHPLSSCVYFQGYFLRIGEMVYNQGKIKVEHTKCLFKDDPYEEFKITWK
jgi:hypothetical protein